MNKGDFVTIEELEPGYSYFCHHIPSNEDWYLIGFDKEGNRACFGGWPPTISKLSDLTRFEKNEPLTQEELIHRDKKFGILWD